MGLLKKAGFHLRKSLLPRSNCGKTKETQLISVSKIRQPGERKYKQKRCGAC